MYGFIIVAHRFGWQVDMSFCISPGIMKLGIFLKMNSIILIMQ